DGHHEPVNFARRNGRWAPTFSLRCTEPQPLSADPSEFRELVRELMYGLNRTERRTWRLLLLGYSILDTAAHEHVSRTAIYERIRGNARKHGGMVKKNDYVRIWWERRNNEHTTS